MLPAARWLRHMRHYFAAIFADCHSLSLRFFSPEIFIMPSCFRHDFISAAGFALLAAEELIAIFRLSIDIFADAITLRRDCHITASPSPLSPPPAIFFDDMMFQYVAFTAFRHYAFAVGEIFIFPDGLHCRFHHFIALCFFSLHGMLLFSPFCCRFCFMPLSAPFIATAFDAPISAASFFISFFAFTLFWPDTRISFRQITPVC